MTNSQSPRLRQRLMLAAGSLLVSLLLAEVAIRVLVPQPISWLAAYRRHPRLPTFALQPMADERIRTGETPWHVISDAEGFRTGRDRPDRSGRPGVLWLGDSFTFGNGVEFEESFVGRVEAALPETSHVNAALGGYGPVQYRAIFEDLLATGHAPRSVVVVIYTGNDFHDCRWNKDIPVKDGIAGFRGGFKDRLSQASHLIRLSAATLRRARGSTKDPHQEVRRQLADPECWATGFLSEAEQIFRGEVEGILETCRERGISAHFVILPTRYACVAVRAGESELGLDETLAVQRAAGILDELGASAVNMLEPLTAQDSAEVFLKFDGHLTPVGHEVVTHAILEAWPNL